MSKLTPQEKGRINQGLNQFFRPRLCPFDLDFFSGQGLNELWDMVLRLHAGVNGSISFGRQGRHSSFRAAIWRETRPMAYEEAEMPIEAMVRACASALGILSKKRPPVLDKAVLDKEEEEWS